MCANFPERSTMNPSAGQAKPLPVAHSQKRRGLLVGMGAAGAAAVAVKALPNAAPQAVPAASAAAQAADTASGYQVSSHVLRYYETTRV
jgi:hypothetical protein